MCSTCIPLASLFLPPSRLASVAPPLDPRQRFPASLPPPDSRSSTPRAYPPGPRLPRPDRLVGRDPRVQDRSRSGGKEEGRGANSVTRLASFAVKISLSIYHGTAESLVQSAFTWSMGDFMLSLQFNNSVTQPGSAVVRILPFRPWFGLFTYNI